MPPKARERGNEMLFWNTLKDFIASNFQVMTVLGGLFALWKWTKSQRQKECEFLERFVSTFRTGIDRTVIDKFDYSSAWYKKEFHKSELEKKVDKTLSDFSYLCFAFDCGMISRKVFDFFGYELHTMLSDKQLIDYLYNLYHNAKFNKAKFPFESLLKYALKHHYVDKTSFCDIKSHEKSAQFHKYLKFEQSDLNNKELFE